MRALLWAAALLVACGTPAPRDAGASTEDDAGLELDAGEVSDGGGADAGSDAGSDAGVRGDGGIDGGVDAGPQRVVVSHERELRGVWVSTVSNLDIAQLTSADAGVAALQALVTRSREAGLNALFFQVRPESDAWYRSTLEPFSRFITGTQGRDPGFDPLETLLDLAHAQGLEVHAWVNPYRGLASASASTAPNHITRTLSSHAITYDNKVTMNPASTEVRAHVVAVVRDLLNRYDVDGLHFDDYFYPYPDSSGAAFPDENSFQSYRADGGTQTKGDWRRGNVNALVREVMQVVRADFPQVRFGVSPFGIWRPQNPPGVTGLDAYEAISCDAVTWMNEGWVDYLAPQLYWPTSSTGQPFVPLATWWANAARGGRHVFAGHGLYRLGTAGWDADEIRAQVQTTRAPTLRSKGLLGGIHFREASIRNNVSGVSTLFRTELYPTPALLPALPRADAVTIPPVPTVTLASESVHVSSGVAAVRFFALYRFTGRAWQLHEVQGAPTARFRALAPGTWAVSAVSRGGGESEGIVFSQ